MVGDADDDDDGNEEAEADKSDTATLPPSGRNPEEGNPIIFTFYSLLFFADKLAINNFVAFPFSEKLRVGRFNNIHLFILLCTYFGDCCRRWNFYPPSHKQLR